MYKKFSLEEIKSIKNDFIPHLYKIIKQEKCQGINDFVKIIFKEGNELYYFEKGDVFFRIENKGGILQLSDEIEKIQVDIPIDHKGGLNELLKNYIIKKERMLGQKTFKEILIDIFKTGKYDTINGKPYIVYDIETTVGSGDLDSFKFLLAYYAAPNQGKMDYEYVGIDDLHEFAQKLIDFDGYIIGFNSFAFDNPITIKQGGFTEEEINLINKKSLDIFYFIRNITGKRLSLNKVSELIGGGEGGSGSSQKTLEGGGSEVEILRNEYKKTGDEKHLIKAKEYCKNDVRMTVLVLLYLLHFQKVAIDDNEIQFDTTDFLKLAKPKTEIKNEEKNTFTNQSIF